MRDVDLYLQTEKLDVDFSHGVRLLSHLTGSAWKCAETIELEHIRRSTGENKDTRELVVEELEDTLDVQDVLVLQELSKDTRDVMIAGVKDLLKSRDREPLEWKKPRRKDKFRSTFKRHSKVVEDNPWPNGSTSLRKRCYT